MKKIAVFWLAILMIAALLVGCGPAENTEATPTDPTTVTEEPTEAPTEEATEAPTEVPTEAEVEDEEDIVYEGDASSYYIDVVYAEQIERYHTALAEKWDEGNTLRTA